jgi:hypothetical protein
MYIERNKNYKLREDTSTPFQHHQVAYAPLLQWCWMQAQPSALMTTGVLNSKTGVDRASFFHDQYGPNIMRERNRRANSKWMGQAKTASFSHDSWSKTYKREWDATKRSCRDARDLCGTVNTIGTVVGNAVTTIVGSTIFSIANAISGTGTWMHKNKLYYKKGGKIF